MFRLCRAAPLLIAWLAAAPAWAQVYKWVDDKGVVNYSSRAPVDRQSSVLDPNSVWVSTYTPRETPSRSPKAPPSAGDRALQERLTALERNLEAERYARYSAELAQTRYLEMRAEQCARDRRVDCDLVGFDPYYAPYWTTVVVSPHHHRHFHGKPPIRPVRAPIPSRPAFAPARAPAPGVPTI